MRVGIVGVGAFAQNFIPLFAAHPAIEEVALCDSNADRLADACSKHGIPRGFASYQALLESSYDTVALFTQHWTHGPLCIEALDAAKHVFTSVPPAVSIDELAALVAAVERNACTYVLAETSYYYPQAVYCRERARAGDFGDIVHIEAEYLHDWTRGYYAIMERRRGESWRSESGDPPLHYPTHTTSLGLSLNDTRATHVSAVGFVDRVPEDRDIYNADNPWGNVFSNESALLQLADGSSCRINEFRRVGHSYPGTVRFSVFGTEACFEENSAGAVWGTREPGQVERLDHLFDASSGVAPVHDGERLPRELVRPNPPFFGSPAFLVDDFVRACLTGDLPPTNVWRAARWMLPGLIGHESARAGGQLLPIPDLG